MAIERGLSGPFAPTAEDLSQCVRCGLCLQSCPTFVETGLETESPRGRLYLMRALTEGLVDLTPNAVGHLDMCLQCRNCEAVCPSGVPFGRIMEHARASILSREDAPRAWRLRSLFLREVVARPERLRLLMSAIRAFDRTGLRSVAERVPLLRDRVLQAPAGGRREFRETGIVARPEGRARARVALLSGCIMPLAYGRIHRATARVLARNGCEVIVPAGQVCCGALHAHNGDLEFARGLARRNVETFLAAGVDAIVVNSAGCGAAMKEYGSLLAGDAAYREKSALFAGTVRDISEYLVDLPLDPSTGELNATVTYQDSCHLAHAQRITRAPREMLGAVPGLNLVEMDAPDRCCGSAGIYGFTQPAMSLRLLDSKMRAVAATRASLVASANPGCIAQLESGLRRHRIPGRAVHVVELLDRAYRSESAARA